MRKTGLITFILFILLPGVLKAQASISWDGGGGDNEWTNPLNWVGNVLPTITQKVFANNAIINVSGQATGNSLKMGNVIFTVNQGGKLTLGFPQASQYIDTTLYLENTAFVNKGVVNIQGFFDTHALLMIHSAFVNGDSINTIDSLNFSYTAKRGIELDALSGFQNAKNAIITFTNMDGPSIVNHNRFTNKGKIYFDDIRGAIYNYDTLVNQNDIYIYDSRDSITIINEGYFNNIDSLRFRYFQKNGVKNSGVFYNRENALFQMNHNNTGNPDDAIYNSGRFYNIGKMQIDSIGSKSINNIKYFKNTGEINFLNSSGISNSDTLVNNDMLQANIGYETGTWFSNSGYWINNDTILLNNIRVDGVCFLNSGTFINSSLGFLSIDSTRINLTYDYPIALKNTGRLLNNGKIDISKTFGWALHNYNTSDSLINNGELNVDWFGVEGFINENGKFRNNTDAVFNITGIAVFNVSDPIDHGVWNKSNSVFENLGDLTIRKTSNNALRNENSLMNLDGEVLIDSTVREAIHNVSGDLIILPDANVAVTNNYFQNFGILKNEDFLQNNGNLSLAFKCVSTSNYAAMTNSDTIINNGNIIVNGDDKMYGIINSAFFQNTKDIELKKCFQYGLNNSGYFHNLNAAVFKIDSGASGILTSSKIDNFGEISIKNQTGIGLNMISNTSGFNNYGKLNLFMNKGNGININNSLLENKTGGKIEIDSCGFIYGNGLNIVSNATFNNLGKTTIKRNLNMPLYMSSGILNNSDSLILYGCTNDYVFFYDAGDFYNNANGYVETIGNTSSVHTQWVTSKPITNNGTLFFRDFPKSALYLQADFINGTNGKIRFKNGHSVTNYALNMVFGLKNQGEILFEDINLGLLLNSGGGYISNYGKLDLADTDSLSLYTLTADSVLNKTCGTIKAGAKLVMTEFKNYGFTELSYTGLSDITNTGKFINYGLLIDRNSSLKNESFFKPASALKEITNEGIFMFPFLGNLNNGIRETANMLVGSSPISLGANWYSNQALSNLAGTYNATGYFTPNTTANAASEIYFSANFLTCPQTVSVPHKLNYTCPYPKLNMDFTNAQGNNNWSDHKNWSRNRQPDYCDNAVFSQSFLTSKVFPAYKAKANILSIDAFPNSTVLEIQTGAVADFPNNH